MARKRGSLRQREPGRERDRNERVAEIVHADRLAAVSVQPCGVTSCVDGPEHVPTAVRPSTQGREHERVRLHADEPSPRAARRCACNSSASRGSTGTVAAEVGFERRTETVRPELRADGQRAGLEVDVAPAKAERPPRAAAPHTRRSPRPGRRCSPSSRAVVRARRRSGSAARRSSRSRSRTTFCSTTSCRTP
jgi:hypothetical protein